MIEIHRVTPGNTSLLPDIMPDVFDEPVDPARLARYAAAPGHIMLVALDGATVVGQVAAVLHYHPDKPTELYIDEVGVSPAWQRQGIARRMLDMVVELGRKEGAEEVWAGTEPDNAPAKALYGSRADAEHFLMFVWNAEN
jgi:ribosomal protein S18 acetylase RimI-like enzyme